MSYCAKQLLLSSSMHTGTQWLQLLPAGICQPSGRTHSSLPACIPAVHAASVHGACKQLSTWAAQHSFITLLGDCCLLLVSTKRRAAAAGRVPAGAAGAFSKALWSRRPYPGLHVAGQLLLFWAWWDKGPCLCCACAVRMMFLHGELCRSSTAAGDT
jgi:hypothetical protein